MAANYVLLEKITVGAAGASSVTFANIPQTGYTDLLLKVSVRTNYAGLNDAVYVYPNGSGSNGTRRALYGTGSAAGSENAANIRLDYLSGNTTTSNTFGSGELYIPNYTSSNYKSMSMEAVAESNTTAMFMAMTAGLWSSTSAITSLQLTPLNGSFMQFSTFYLYGVASLGTTPTIAPKATGGDTVMTDGTYWYHAFKSSGTFTPTVGLTCDYLVVAGGAAGYNGGGGAGGLRSTVTATGGGGSLETAKSFASNAAYTITVGAGGSAYGSNGSDSSIAGSGLTTITSIGGGSAGGSGGVGKTGGSGGGGQDGGAGGAGTANQGYAGGGTNASGAYAGGGGAGAVGGNSIAGSGGGAGGAGVAISAFATPTGTGVSGYYAGGGGGCASTTGGSGGAGGGGNGESNTTGRSAGIANTGGGGGGAYSGTGGTTLSYGGSGIVIIRYAV